MFLELRALKCWNEKKTRMKKNLWFQMGGLHPRKFNIDPEKWWLEDYFPFKMANFQANC